MAYLWDVQNPASRSTFVPCEGYLKDGLKIVAFNSTLHPEYEPVGVLLGECLLTPHLLALELRVLPGKE